MTTSELLSRVKDRLNKNAELIDSVKTITTDNPQFHVDKYNASSDKQQAISDTYALAQPSIYNQFMKQITEHNHDDDILTSSSSFGDFYEYRNRINQDYETNKFRNYLMGFKRAEPLTDDQQLLLNDIRFYSYCCDDRLEEEKQDPNFMIYFNTFYQAYDIDKNMEEINSIIKSMAALRNALDLAEEDEIREVVHQNTQVSSPPSRAPSRHLSELPSLPNSTEDVKSARSVSYDVFGTPRLMSSDSYIDLPGLPSASRPAARSTTTDQTEYPRTSGRSTVAVADNALLEPTSGWGKVGGLSDSKQDELQLLSPISSPRRNDSQKTDNDTSGNLSSGGSMSRRDTQIRNELAELTKEAARFAGIENDLSQCNADKQRLNKELTNTLAEMASLRTDIERERNSISPIEHELTTTRAQMTRLVSEVQTAKMDKLKYYIMTLDFVLQSISGKDITYRYNKNNKEIKLIDAMIANTNLQRNNTHVQSVSNGKDNYRGYNIDSLITFYNTL